MNADRRSGANRSLKGYQLRPLSALGLLVYLIRAWIRITHQAPVALSLPAKVRVYQISRPASGSRLFKRIA